jgi:hypothetical protein
MLLWSAAMCVGGVGTVRVAMTWPDLGATCTIVWFDVPMSKVSFDA